MSQSNDRHRMVGRITRMAGAAVATVGLLFSTATAVLAGGMPAGAAHSSADVALEGCGLVPLDVEIIIDRSGSMGSNISDGHTRMYWAQHAADQLVDSLAANGGVGSGQHHHVGVTSFHDTSASVAIALGTSSAAAVKAAIDGLTASGNTPLAAGMATGATDMTNHKRTTDFGLAVRHVMIIMSDGRPWPDSAPARPSASQITAFKAAADAVYSIAIGTGGTSGTANEVDLALMASLANPSGNAFHVVQASDLPALFGDIFTDIACQPGIHVTKSADPTSLPAVGGDVTYTYMVDNVGNVALTDVSVSDDKCSPVTYVSGDANSNDKLDLSETWKFTCSATLAATTTNTATATGHDGDTTVTDEAKATVTVDEANPGIGLDKTADQAQLPAGGGDVEYSYAVTNDGNVPLSDVSVVDDKCDSPAYKSGDTNGDSKLDTDETWLFTCQATLHETTTNHATATGYWKKEPVSANDEATVTVTDTAAGIHVDKVADPTELPAGGGDVTYTYTVTNIGNIALGNVTVDDDKCDSPTYQSGDANANGKLDTDETWTFTCSMTLTATTTNVATATGWYGDDQSVQDQDDATVTVAEAQPSPSGSVAAETGKPRVTPPSTSTADGPVGTTGSSGILLMLAVFSIIASVLIATPRRLSALRVRSRNDR